LTFQFGVARSLRGGRLDIHEGYKVDVAQRVGQSIDHLLATPAAGVK
jgi:hypothetical protein